MHRLAMNGPIMVETARDLTKVAAPHKWDYIHVWRIKCGFNLWICLTSVVHLYTCSETVFRNGSDGLISEGSLISGVVLVPKLSESEVPLNYSAEFVNLLAKCLECTVVLEIVKRWTGSWLIDPLYSRKLGKSINQSLSPVLPSTDQSTGSLPWQDAQLQLYT